MPVSCSLHPAPATPPARITGRVRTLMWPPSGVYLMAFKMTCCSVFYIRVGSMLMATFANDMVDDLIFAGQLYGFRRPSDVLIAISRNVPWALRVAPRWA